MPQTEGQRIKLLALYEILSRKSDEAHPLSMSDIIVHLSAYGVRAERKALYNDIEALRTLGYDVITVKSKTTGYYLGSRRYELSELKLLADAVACARFITEKKSAALIGKLAEEASDYDGAKLRRQVHNRSRVKTMNESVYYSIDLIHTAIMEDKKILFHYFRWNEKKEKVLRRDGALYSVSPIALSWDDENYYLIGYDHDAEGIRHYRVDKMLHLSVSKEKREQKDSYKSFDLAAYTDTVFGMYGGDTENVTLRVHNSLAGVVFDRFGHDVTPVHRSDESFLIHVRVAVSPNFLSWVMGFGEKMKVESPSRVAEQVKALAEEVLLTYR